MHISKLKNIVLRDNGKKLQHSLRNEYPSIQNFKLQKRNKQITKSNIIISNKLCQIYQREDNTQVKEKPNISPVSKILYGYVRNLSRLKEIQQQNQKIQSRIRSRDSVLSRSRLAKEYELNSGIMQRLTRFNHKLYTLYIAKCFLQSARRWELASS